MNEQLKEDINQWQDKADTLISKTKYEWEDLKILAQSFEEARTLLLRASLSL